MTAQPDIDRIAKSAAREVEAKIVQMLMSAELGDIVIAVGFNEARVFVERKELIWRQKLNRGHWSAIKQE